MKAPTWSRQVLRATALSSALALLVLLAAASPVAARSVVDGFGTYGTLGGQLNTPAGIAVNNSGIGAPEGTTYVVDSGDSATINSNRVQRFDPSGAFEAAWGQNVHGRDERQRISINPKAGPSNSILGTFTLSYGAETTGPITVRTNSSNGAIVQPTAATIKSALEALFAIGLGDVSVNGSGTEGWTVRFTGSLGGTDLDQLAADSSAVPGYAVSVATLEDGMGGPSAGFEVCNVAAECQDGIAADTTANGGQLGYPQGVAVNQANGHVYVTEAGNFRVSEFEADGDFVRTWGRDVDSGGGTGFEICTVPADCKRGVPGAGAGEFGELLNSPSIGYPTVDSDNNVWVPDPGNHRIQVFGPDGAFVAVHGYDVDALGGGGGLESCTSAVPGACRAATTGNAAGQFNGDAPSRIAFDADGFLYAIDDGNNRVQRFDPELASSTSFAVSTLAGLTSKPPQAIGATEGGARIAFVVNPGGAFYGERRIVELDPADGSLEDSSLVGAGLGASTTCNCNDPIFIKGLASDDTTGTLLATTFNRDSPRRVIALRAGTPPDPVVTIDPVTTTGETTATFTGSVDPTGAWVACTFQYSTDELTWTDVGASDCDALDVEGGARELSQEAIGLTPATRYFVRLRVSRPLTPGSAVLTGVEEFETEGPTPSVANVGAVSIDDRSVRLVATIDPRNSPTSYVFEYGATSELGSSTDPVAVGGGSTPKVVSQLIEGLEPDTTYHFKVVATNGAGSSEVAQTFTTRALPLPLPDERAYEQVTPDTAGNVHNVNEGAIGGADLTVGANGEAFGVCNEYPAGGQAPNGDCADYVSYRGDDGWEAKPLAPPFCATDPATGELTRWLQAFVSVNLDQALVSMPESATCVHPPRDPSAPTPSVNLYRRGMIDGSMRLLTPARGFGPSSLDNRAAVLSKRGSSGASKDFSHIVYTSTGNQSPDSPPAGDFNKLFEWHDGVVRLVSVKPNGEPFTDSSYLAAPGIGGVSANGERIFFFNTDPTEQTGITVGTTPPAASVKVYMRQGGTSTFEVGESECTAACGPPGYEFFGGANPDASAVLLYSMEKLTDDDTSAVAKDLYIYRHSADPAADPDNLTLLSKDDEPADGGAADVQGVLGMSDDGNTVFFAANGQILPGGPTAQGPKVYRWRWNGGSPTVDYLATLTIRNNNTTLFGCNPGYALGNWNDENNWLCDQRAGRRVRAVTPDGEVLMLDTAKPLDPVADADADRDVYRWDDGHGWRCLSCQVPGAPSAGDSQIKGAIGVHGANISTQSQMPYLVSSDDGEKIFFTSRDRLVEQDTNGTVRDVYQWNDGRLSLISSGVGARDNLLIGTTATADDVFFMTDERLVGWDGDIVNDVYDARVGGGFPEPPPSGERCEGEACQGSGAQRLTASPQTGKPGGEDNMSPGARKALRVARPSARARRQAARAGTLPIRVRTNRAGVVRLVARARIGRKATLVGRNATRARKAGPMTVRLRLNRRARAALRRGRSLRLRIEVRSPGARARTVTVRLPGVKS